MADPTAPFRVDPLAILVAGALEVLPGVFAGGPKGPNRRQRDALVAAGAERIETRGGRFPIVTWRLADGTIISNERARGVAGVILGAAPIGTPGINPGLPVPSTGPSNPFEELLRRNPTRPQTPFEELLRKPRSRPPSDFDELLRKPRYQAGASSLAAILARSFVLIGGLLHSPTAGEGSDLRDIYTNRKGPRTRARVRRPPPPIKPRVVLSEPLPRKPPALPTAQPLPVPVSTQPLPNPQPSGTTAPESRVQPQPAPRPRPTAAPAPRPSPVRSPFLLPLLTPFLSPAPTFRPSRNVGASVNPFAPALQPRGLTGFQGNPLASPLTLTQPQFSSDPCQCNKPTRTRKKRKPRTVCYRGTYVEKSSGITKFKREKIRCQ